MTVESDLGTASYDQGSFTGEALGDGSFEAVVGGETELSGDTGRTRRGGA